MNRKIPIQYKVYRRGVLTDTGSVMCQPMRDFCMVMRTIHLTAHLSVGDIVYADDVFMRVVGSDQYTIVPASHSDVRRIDTEPAGALYAPNAAGQITVVDPVLFDEGEG